MFDFKFHFLLTFRDNQTPMTQISDIVMDQIKMFALKHRHFNFHQRKINTYKVCIQTNLLRFKIIKCR